MAIPIPAGMVPAPVVPGTIALTHVRPDERRAELLIVVRRLQGERDDHAAACHARPPRCLALWALDERLRICWAEIEFLGGDAVDLYQPRPCPPECPDCGPDPRDGIEPRSVLDLSEAVGL